jgi:hypothetical protein
MTAAPATAISWYVYIDGLNFYSSVRGRPTDKWVDFRRYSERLVPSEGELRAVKYFTSQISAKAAEDPASPQRQRVFIPAVKATPGVDVYEGKFRVPDEWRSMSRTGGWAERFRPPLPNTVVESNPDHFATHADRPWKVRVQLPQEKFTDVAIATHLLRDFYRGDCSHAIVVSNDADLGPAIELAVSDGHDIGVFSPVQTVSRDLARVASWSKSIRPDLASQCQLPDLVPVPGGTRVLNRPAAWK